MNKEYNNSANGASCNYANLGAYNQGYSMQIAPVGRTTQGSYIVPQWNAISYDSLTGDIPTCSGFATIESAYGTGAGNCQTTYRTTLCGNKQ